MGYGLIVSLVGSIFWGAIFAYGYVSLLASLAIGYGISWAVAKGAGTVTTGLILLTVILTLFTVFLGGVVAIVIALGVNLFEAFSLYPALMAVAPGDVALGFVFGMVGAGYGAYGLWRQREGRGARAVAPPTWNPGPVPGGTPPAGTPAIPAPAVHRGAYDVSVELTVPTRPPHTVRAYYTTMTGRAEVFLDGHQIAKTRVWGMKKDVEVPLPDATERVQVRFRGAVAPAIDVLLNGNLLATT